MRQALFIRSSTFRWALAVAGVFAIVVIVLFSFVYWQTDDYLIARSDRMIASQLNFIAGLPNERLLDAIDQHLRQDSRGVQHAGLFAADGRRITGNLERLPPELKMNSDVQNVSIVRKRPGSSVR
jgi:hypothetical protein